MSRGDQNELRSEGQAPCASGGQSRSADAPQPHDDGGGQSIRAAQASDATPLPPSPELPGEGQRRDGKTGQRLRADAGQPPLQDEGQSWTSLAGQFDDADVLQPVIQAIRYHHRNRLYAMDQRKRSDQSILAFLKSNVLGWSKSLPKAEGDAIAERAAAMIAVGEAEAEIEELEAQPELSGKDRLKLKRLRAKASTDDPMYLEYRPLIMTQMRVRAPFAAFEETHTKELERLAAALPVWDAWAKNVRGFSSRGLGTIIGAAGDLSTYPKKGHLWKRMAVAVIGAGDGVNDRRQGGLSKNAPKEEWIAHGYDRRRRSLMFVIGEGLIKQRSEYYDVYRRRKDYERAVAKGRGLEVAPSAAIPRKRAAEFMSEGYVHKRAKRYMEKRLLRDLWNAWRSANVKMLHGPSIAADRRDRLPVIRHA